MVDKTSDRIPILEGLEPIRKRPAMYIGADRDRSVRRAALLEYVISMIADERPPEVRILLWREDTVTIAYDGSPLPIEPFGLPVNGVSHPALYQSFMYLLVGREPPVAVFGAILNALCERLVVSTMHNGHRHRVVFSKGMLLTLLRRTHCDHPLGITWLTFRPDATIIAGKALTLDEVRGIAEHIGGSAEGVRIHVEDRTTEDADWD